MNALTETYTEGCAGSVKNCRAEGISSIPADFEHRRHHRLRELQEGFHDFGGFPRQLYEKQYE